MQRFRSVLACLAVVVAVLAVAFGTDLETASVQPRPQPSAPRRVLTEEFHLGPSELSEGSRSGLTVGTSGLKLASGRNVGHLLSPILESDIPFNYVGLFWSSSNPDGSSLAFWVRTSPDGRSWSPWQSVQVDMPPGPLAEYDTYGSLIWADRANYVQFSGELGGASEKPAVNRIGLTLLNPYDGPIVETAADLSDGGFANTAFAAEADSHLEAGAAPAAAIGKPITFKREDWGADESLRFSGSQEIWPREYVPTKKLVVHHTATGNSYATVEDAKALVRAIYTYHASTLGWGDIGYNSLVDKFGNSYEGRRGRDGPGYDGPGGREILSEDVVGGHASSYNHGSSGISLLGTFCTPGECLGGGNPTAAMLSRLKDVLTWESQQHGIDPQGNSDFLRYNGTWHRGLPNIVGHRDVAATTCPGGNVYALLPQLRSDVAAFVGVVLLFEKWVLHTGTPLGQTGSNFAFEAGDHNRDGTPDLMAIEMDQTATNSTEVHILSGVSSFQTWLLHTGTALHPTSPATWTFGVGDWNGDGTPDLFAIKMNNTESGKTEVHILSGGSNFQQWLLHAATALHPTDATNWAFAVADWDGLGRPDLIAVKKQGVASTEAHILSGESDFSRFAMQTGTPLHKTGSEFTFEAGDFDGDGTPDLLAIKTNNTGSGWTEVHILSGGSSFQQWLLQAATALHTTDAINWAFAVADWTRYADGTPDLIAIKKQNAASNSTEVHILAGEG